VFVVVPAIVQWPLASIGQNASLTINNNNNNTIIIVIVFKSFKRNAIEENVACAAGLKVK